MQLRRSFSNHGHIFKGKLKPGEFFVLPFFPSSAELFSSENGLISLREEPCDLWSFPWLQCVLRSLQTH